MYSKEFNSAFALLMVSEVGPWFDPTDIGTQQGLINTAAQRKAVGYVNHPADPGGETKFGIAQASHPHVVVKTLTLDQSKEIYYNGYWITAHCDKITSPLNAMLLDASVNHGTLQATKFLQTALGLKVDGSWGPQTMNAVMTCKDIKTACSKYLDARQKFFDKLVVTKPQLAVFKNGWNARITMLSAWLLKQT